MSLHSSVSSAALLSPFVNSLACSLDQGQYVSGCCSVLTTWRANQASLQDHIPSTKLSHHPVDNRNVLVLHVVHNYLANIRVLHEVSIPCQQPGSARHFPPFYMSLPFVSMRYERSWGSRVVVQRNSRSPRWKAGSILPERTTTMGEGESVMTESLRGETSASFSRAVQVDRKLPLPHHEGGR